MSPKYETGDNSSSTTRWNSDQHYVLAEWSSKPFVGHRHRSETVEHQIVLEYHDGVGCDIMHWCRSEDTDKFPDDWKAVETIEIREYGASVERAPEARWVS